MLRLSASNLRRLSTKPGTNWEALIAKAASPEARQELARLQGIYNKVATDAAASQAPPAPIDFPAYRAKMSNGKKVDAFENALKKLVYPQSKLTTVQQQQSKLEELMNAAKAEAETSAARSKELSTLLDQLKAGRTTKDTTVDEVTAIYPAIEKEVQQEAKEEQWGKGLGL